MYKRQGYKVCLDDFGAGSASFQYLHHLHVDYVKIDGEYTCLLYTSDAADERSSVDLGGRRIIKKKNIAR